MFELFFLFVVANLTLRSDFTDKTAVRLWIIAFIISILVSISNVFQKEPSFLVLTVIVMLVSFNLNLKHKA